MAAQLKSKHVDFIAAQVAEPKISARAIFDVVGRQPVPSPARELQSSLEVAFEDIPRWSTRRTLAFAVVTCGAFWMGVALVMARILAH